MSNARALVDQALQGIQSGRDFTVELPNGTRTISQSMRRRHPSHPTDTHHCNVACLEADFSSPTHEQE